MGSRQRQTISLTAGPLIEVVNRQRTKTVDAKRAAQLARAVLNKIGAGEATLTISFIRDRRMRELNRTYRGIDAPTDVLSFAYHESEDAYEFAADAQHLGDLVISVETAERYAGELGVSLAREIEHLVIHGALHLAGYDHETDQGEMNRLERRLRKQLLST
ncbi:MAG: rRNA maturation RNase YbeY [Acidobacteria bacterium]|nr:rRNA maturation RNase YbeY [Acidobacteriota bacterium]MBI3425417.1 rRNA maturation RNase YbeY [Acidobacteriota bacterium]